TQDIRGCLWLSVCTHKASVAVCRCPCVSVCVCQHTQDVRGCPSVHISARLLSVQYIHNVRRCPSAHTGRLCVSFSTHRTSMAVRVCRLHTQDVRGYPSVHISSRCTLTLLVDCSGDFGPRGLSVQYTQDVRGCPLVHTGRPWLYVCVCACLSVSVSTHITFVAVHRYTYQHLGPWTQHTGPSRGLFGMLVLGLSMLALPVDCLGDFGPRGLSVQYTQYVRGCPPAHTGRRPWLSVCVQVCPSAHTGRPWLSISTHISTTSVAVHQYTYQHVGPWTQHAGPSHGLFGTPVLGLSTLALPVDCSGNFGPRGLSAQCTQDICGCPSAHTGRPWVSVSTHRTSVAVLHTGRLWVSASTHRTSVAVLQYTYQNVGPWTQHAGPSHVGCLFSTHRTYVGVRQHTQDVRGCLWLSVQTHKMFVCPCVTHRTSVGVRQHTQDVRGCPCVSVCVRQHTQDVRGLHTGRPWVSVSTHRTSVCVSQHTQDIRGCPCVSVTHKTSVGVRQHTQDVCGCPTLALPVDCLGDFGPRGLSVQYTKHVCGCPPADTGRLWLSVADVRVCPCESVSTHRTSVAVHQYTYQHAGPWSQHAGPSSGLFGTHSTSVGVRQHTQDVCGCLWLSVSTHRTSMAVCVSVYVCGCLPAYTGRLWLSVVHTGHLWVSISTHRTSVGVRQHTQDVRGCLCVSVCVRLCPSAHRGRPWLSISTHISTLVLGLSTLALPVDYMAHTGRTWLSISTHINTLVLGLSTLTLPADCS
ncbi:unnamed protein product, partial [Brassica rapa]